MTILANSICLAGADGAGKCLGRGTPILMFDGSVKVVEDVVEGDLLMGPDSTPRKVLSLARGREMMYRVTPSKGDAYVVNESHVLSLRMSYRAAHHKKDDVVNISVRDYLLTTQYFKQNSKGWRTGVEFPSQTTLLDPYFLGVWLGDGSSDAARITSADPEIVRYLEEFCIYNEGLELHVVQSPGKCATYGIVRGGPKLRGVAQRWVDNPVKLALKRYGIFGSKRIPRPYLINSRENRLRLLAGLIDTDGSHHRGCIYFTIKSEGLADDIVFLARSLGFAAYKSRVLKTCTNPKYRKTGEYYHISISGHLDEVPVLLARKKCGPRQQTKNVLRVGIAVDPIGVDDYYGFTIDGDHLFLLGDFTVTHNTTQAERLVRRLAEKGVGVRVCTVWDMFDQARPGAIPFESKRDIDRFLGGLHPDARAMFLHMAMREALDRALDDRGDRVLVLVGYWLKYNATERAYGASPTLLDHLGEAFPEPDLKLYMALDPETSLARKAVISGYESGLSGRDGFVDFQARVHGETTRLLERTGPWRMIDSAQPIDAVEAAIAEQVDAWLDAGALR